MRLFVVLGCLLLVGCTGPHSTGALWAQRDIEQETDLYRLTDTQRADRVHVFEFGLADEILIGERARLEASLQACPGPGAASEQLAPSVGDKPRDIARLRARDDPARLMRIAQLALADWRVRRAHATGDARFCDDARLALAGNSTAATTPDLLDGVGLATVTRDPGRVVSATDASPVSTALSTYALGFADSVRATAPLPQYLAAVYGGVVLGATATPALNGATPESLVDRFAPAYPDWEPDALYAVLVNVPE